MRAARPQTPSCGSWTSTVNDDSFCTALDVLAVIHRLNAESLLAAEGQDSAVRDPFFDDLEADRILLAG